MVSAQSSPTFAKLPALFACHPVASALRHILGFIVDWVRFGCDQELTICAVEAILAIPVDLVVDV
jgi:hypothetical protein